MMSIRAVWIVPLPGGNGPEEILFIKTYPTVEKRSLIFSQPEHYVPIPPESILCEATLGELELKQPIKKYVESRDTCERQFQKPVFEISVPGGKLWPVVIIEKFGLLFCCLPLVEQGCEPRPPLIQILGISLGFTLLGALADFLSPLPRDFNAAHPKLLELFLYMCQAAPFGTLIDINPATVREAVQNRHTGQLVLTHTKQPAWRPITAKGKPTIQFSIAEQVRAVLYNSNNMEDDCSIYGTISCKADLEAVMPEVTATLSVPDSSPPLDNVIVHPCVQGGDTALVGSGVPMTKSEVTSPGSSPTKRTLRFIPPREQFTLAYYTSTSAIKPPLTANYSMKGTQREVSLSFNVKLNPKVKNAMEYCEVQLSFYNRGIITDIDVTPSIGSVSVPIDKRRLAWNIGQRFPSRSLEATLQAKIKFAEYDEKRQSGAYEDPFCVGFNAYAMIYFRFADYTYTGCQIESRSLQVHPTAKPKLTLTKEFTSSEYKVWNTHGDAQAVFPVPKYLLQ